MVNKDLNYDEKLRVYTKEEFNTATPTITPATSTATTGNFTVTHSIVGHTNRAEHRALMRSKKPKDKKRGVMPPLKGRR